MEVLEAVLVHCWESALRRRPIGVDDNFYAVGGHSLTAIRIAHRITDAFGVEVEYLMVLESGTIAVLAQGLVERAAEAGVTVSELSEAGRAYLLKRGVAAAEIG
ncbi:phosphopantetheine-binding protein [Plantactinospora solaniradicis]|uniref:Phosphopantetheine-binding protein n=1 Tax=Plantactinospora solaniradicis TaxID=1723736 RepID=A0ABW1K834_9ACTN